MMIKLMVLGLVVIMIYLVAFAPRPQSSCPDNPSALMVDSPSCQGVIKPAE